MDTDALNRSTTWVASLAGWDCFKVCSAANIPEIGAILTTDDNRQEVCQGSECICLVLIRTVSGLGHAGSAGFLKVIMPFTNPTAR
jgi:hypothetical protein